MSDPRFQRVHEIFKRACDAAPTEREAVIIELASDDDDLAAEVRSLLEIEDSLPGYMRDEALAPGAVARLAQVTQRDEAAESPVPERIDRYEIIDVLGEGGMGIVYRARQRNPEREVAVKVIRGGAHVNQQRLRLFHREIQSLARLEHPGIASIYEAGCTEDGQHYFALELVKGVPLTEHIRRSNPTTRQRLAMFMQICNAINYAHQRGVIHRDLKPSNVLIDTQGNPRILDFGLAKITETDVSITMQPTLVGQIQGTLSYMSPEQARGRPDDIDLRSDVYSLGVILFELLTDRLPYDLAQISLPEAIRCICDDPPVRASSIRRVLRGDLETIVHKALEKAPNQRYASVAALAEDIERYLTDQPILARPHSFTYQMGKVMRRHKVPTALLAMLFLSLTTFSVILWLQVQRIEEERDIAVTARLDEETARAGADEVADFMVGLFEAANARMTQGVEPGVRDLLDEGARQIDSLNEQPLVQARLLEALGRASIGMGAIADVTEQLRESLAIRELELGDDHLDVASVLSELALHESNPEEMKQMFQRTLEIRRSRLGPDDELITESLTGLATALHYQGAFAESLEYLKEGHEMLLRLLGDEHSLIATSLHNLGTLHGILGQTELAEQRLTAALDMRRTLGLKAEIGVTLESLAGLAWGGQDYEQAEFFMRQSIENEESIYGRDHPFVAFRVRNLASVLTMRDRRDEALPLRHEVLATMRRAYPADHFQVMDALNDLGKLLCEMENHSEAESLLREAISIGTGHSPELTLTDSCRQQLAKCLMGLKRYDDAEPLLLEACASLVAAHGASHDLAMECIQQIVDLYDAWHETEPVAGHDTKATEWRAKLPPAEGETKDASPDPDRESE